MEMFAKVYSSNVSIIIFIKTDWKLKVQVLEIVNIWTKGNPATAFFPVTKLSSLDFFY